MNMFITGANGWIGSELTETLLREGHFVKILVRSKNEKIKNLKESYKDKLDIIIGNILDCEKFEDKLCDIDVLYHLAAKVHFMPKNEKDEKEFFKVNTIASEGLFNLAIKNNVKRVIFYSSVSVYANSDNLITVSSKKNPITPYAKSKLMAENIALKLFEENNFPVTIIEPVTVYGGDDVGNFEKLKRLIDKGVSPIFNGGSNKKTIIYYKDLVKMTINISKDDDAIGKIFICGTEIITLNDIINILIKTTNKNVIVVKINKVITNLILKFFNIFNFSITNKIARQIKVLSSNNIYNIEDVKKYIDTYTIFEEYYRN